MSSSGKGAVRVLVMRAGALGDTVFATSIIEPLRLYFGPSCRVDFVLRKGMGALFTHDPRIHRVFEVQYRRLPFLLSPEKIRILLAMTPEPYDLLVNLESARFFNGLARMIPAGQKYGSPFPEADDDRRGEHAVERLRRLYAHFLPAEVLDSAVPSLVSPPPDSIHTLSPLPSRYLVLHPTIRHFDKNDYRSYKSWPAAHWESLVHLLLSERSEHLVVIGARGEEDHLGASFRGSDRVVSLAGRTSLEELRGVLARAEALVAADTGPAHVAAALGTPVVAIFGPTDPVRTGPYDPGGRLGAVVSARVACSPCAPDGRPRDCPWNRCMHEVRPEDVANELRRLVPQSHSRGRPGSAGAGAQD